MTYKKECKILLENSFPRVSCATINAVLQHPPVDFDFPTAFRLLTTTIQPCFPNDNDAKAACRPLVLPAKMRVFLKHDRPRKTLYIRDVTLRTQVNDIPELVHGDNNPPNDGKKPGVPALKEEIIECGCCYSDFPKSQLHCCSGNPNHLVCQECIQRFVSEQLDGNDSVQFPCIVHADCGSDYTRVLLDQVLSPKLKQRTNDRIFRDEVKRAGLPVWTCPKCAYLGFMHVQSKTIECAECKVCYCVACNLPAHKNQTCESARREQELLKNPVHRAHDAMNKAITRRCPVCQKEFVKSDGCNKMTCVKCKSFSCYLCGAKVQGYDHFCDHHVNATKQNPCKKCGKTCELFTNTFKMERNDRIAARKAGTAVLREAGITDQQEIERIIGTPEKKQAPLGVGAAPAPAALARPRVGRRIVARQLAPPAPREAAVPEVHVNPQVDVNQDGQGRCAIL